MLWRFPRWRPKVSLRGNFSPVEYSTANIPHIQNKVYIHH